MQTKCYALRRTSPGREDGVVFPSYLSRVYLGSQVSTKLLPPTIRPLTAHLKLTENCQARCISCDYWKSRWQDDISTDRAVELLREIAALGIRSLRFTGGEPLLRKDLFEILQKSAASSFKRIILQTNGLLLKKLHKEINASPITNISLSIDGLKETNDHIRGIRGYFDLGMEGIKLLEGKRISLSVTLNRISADELQRLGDVAHQAGADLEFNLLSQSLYFLKDSNIASMWPAPADTQKIVKFVRDVMKRPSYEVDYISDYYNKAPLAEPACVLGFTQVFIVSNGDVLTGCYPLKPVGNILTHSLSDILASEDYYRQSVAMIRRECPGCTCGIETSLAMKHAGSSAFFELGRLMHPQEANRGSVPINSPTHAEQTSHT